jgi:hypothetical protein
VTLDTHDLWDKDTPTPEQSAPVTSVAAGNAGRRQIKDLRHAVYVEASIDTGDVGRLVALRHCRNDRLSHYDEVLG